MVTSACASCCGVKEDFESDFPDVQEPTTSGCWNSPISVPGGQHQSAAPVTKRDVVMCIAALVDKIKGRVHKLIEEDIEAARANFEAGFFRRMRTIAGVANLAQFYNLAKGEPDWVAHDLARYDRTPEQVLAAAQEVLSQPRVVMHIWPEPAETEETSEVVAETVGFWARLFGGKKRASEPGTNPAAQGGE